jgi:hypothetical protein
MGKLDTFISQTGVKVSMNLPKLLPQLRKGLILDVRGNGGGNISPMLIEKLRREITLFGVARNTAIVYNPSGLVLGPKVCLLDEFSALEICLTVSGFTNWETNQEAL